HRASTGNLVRPHECRHAVAAELPDVDRIAAESAPGAPGAGVADIAVHPQVRGVAIGDVRRGVPDLERHRIECEEALHHVRGVERAVAQHHAPGEAGALTTG